MKKIGIYCFILFLLLDSCVVIKPLTPPIEPLPLDEAGEYISNFLKHPVYGKIAKEKSLGGAFDRRVLNIPQDKKGILMWFCRDPSLGASPEFFLGLEHVIDYDTQMGVGSPLNDLQIPEYTFTYPKDYGVEPSDVIDYLVNKHKVDNKDGAIPIALNTAKGFIEEFKKDIEELGGNCMTDNCKFPHGYFDGDEGNYLAEFLKNNPKMVRYYFGYDAAYKSNNIRIILIGTDDQGRNIILKTGQSTILQKSVPPPPDN